MKPKRLFYILLALWVIADLLQAMLTPVHADEAYYALYGRFIDWGYYDHPPMIALLTRLSSLLCGGNLSIRLATVILHGGTVWLIWKTIHDEWPSTREVLVFFALATSLVMFSIYGFVTTPDAPLLFFTALFFFLYKKYIAHPNWPLAIATGITIAAMLYSKYMAALLLAFVLLSNIKSLKDKRLWAALALAALLFVPHVIWQFRNDFPSLQYHLIHRNSSFKPKYFLEYLPNQLLVFNPICLVLALYLSFKNITNENKILKSCAFSTIGFIVFFWLMTFKGHAEPHWTVAASIPMIILLYNWLKITDRRKWVNIAIIPLSGLIIIARLFVPYIISEKNDNFQNQSIYDEIESISNGRNVIFTGSFQNPSLYWFYTGNETSSLSSVYGRRTQFDIWQLDKKIQGKPVCVVENFSYRYHPDNELIVVSKNGKLSFLNVDGFQSASRIEVSVEKYDVKNDSIFLNLSLFNPYDLPFCFNHPEMPVTILVAYFLDNECLTTICDIPDNNIVIPPQSTFELSTCTEYIPNCPLALCLDNVVCRSLNSKPITIE